MNQHEVEYLVVGGYAVMRFTEPRFTKDLDVWVGNSRENAAKVYRALAAFGAPVSHDGLTPETFMSGSVVYQIGVAPVRIDLSTHIDGVAFADAWSRRVEGSFYGLPVHFLSLDDLIANKQAAGRRQDLEDVEVLRAIRRKKSRS